MKVGSYVICINDQFTEEQLSKLSKIPKKGNYYTIREIVEYPEFNRTGVSLEEISNPPIEKSDGAMHEPTFSITRFRELDIPSPFEEAIKNVLLKEFEPAGVEDDGLFREIRN